MKFENTKCVVTGGAGFIGSNLVDALLARGATVICIDDMSSEFHDNFYWNDAARNVAVSVTCRESMEPHFAGADYVFHLAAQARIQPSVEYPIHTVETNIDGTVIVLECARMANVKRVVFSSSSSIYGRNHAPNVEHQRPDPMSVYGITKLFGERLMLHWWNYYRVPTVSLRYFNVYGPHEPTRGNYAPVIGRFLKQRERGDRLTIVGTGDQRRDFTHVDDVVEANLAACRPMGSHLFGDIYNIGSGENYSINELAEMVGGPKTHVAHRPQEASQTLADITRAKHALKWEPRKSLPDYIDTMKGLK